MNGTDNAESEDDLMEDVLDAMLDAKLKGLDDVVEDDFDDSEIGGGSGTEGNAIAEKPINNVRRNRLLARVLIKLWKHYIEGGGGNLVPSTQTRHFYRNQNRRAEPRSICHCTCPSHPARRIRPGSARSSCNFLCEESLGI